jgi:hypothetical protein
MIRGSTHTKPHKKNKKWDKDAAAPDERKKKKKSNFFGQKLLTWICPNFLFVVFLNSPC